MKCAMEMNIGPIKQIMESMGISEDEVDSVSDQFDELFGEDGTGFMPGGAGTLPFMNQSEQDDDEEDEDSDGEDEIDEGDSDDNKPQVGPFGIPVINAKGSGEKKKGKKKKGRKFLSLYCTDLTEKAREGKIDRIIGRDNEIYRAVQSLCRPLEEQPLPYRRTRRRQDRYSRGTCPAHSKRRSSREACQKGDTPARPHRSCRRYSVQRSV